MNSEEIDALADAALDAAALLIQEQLGVPTGDLAAMFFCDGIAQKNLAAYIRSEIANQPEARCRCGKFDSLCDC